MLIQIYHKGQWVYLREWDGSRTTANKDLAYKFSNKDAEKMKEELEGLGFQVIII